MIKINNFSGNPEACFKMGEDKFKKAFRGKYSGDIDKLWSKIADDQKPNKKAK